MRSITATDCLNGTWVEDLGVVDYNTLTKTYEQYRSDPRRWVKRATADRENLIPWEEDVVIYNYVSCSLYSVVSIYSENNRILQRRPGKNILCAYESIILLFYTTILHWQPICNTFTEKMILYLLSQTRILKNAEGCVNTLSMECMDFYHRYGRDGSNYTSRAVFDCYYNPDDGRETVKEFIS